MDTQKAELTESCEINVKAFELKEAIKSLSPSDELPENDLSELIRLITKYEDATYKVWEKLAYGGLRIENE